MEVKHTLSLIMIFRQELELDVKTYPVLLTGPREGDVSDVTQSLQPTNIQADSWSDIGTPQVCCVDVQTPNAATVTPVHISGAGNTHDLETACVFINCGESASNGGNEGGNSGVASLSPKLNPAGSNRSRSLSPVKDSNTQQSTVAFNGDANNLSKDIYTTQGARPKMRKGSQPNRPSSVKDLPCPAQNTFAYKNVSDTSAPILTTAATTTISSSPASSVILSDAADCAIVPAELPCSPVSPEPEVADMLKRISSGGGDGGTRWADPASQSIKYIDEEVSDSSELPFENNLVADCSLSAPSSVVLERRLYLAQNMVDGEQGVSPSEDFSPQNEGKATLDQSASVGSKVETVCVSPEDSGAESLPVIHSPATVSGLLSNGVSGSDIEILHSTSLPSSPIHGASKAETPTRKMREEMLKGQCRHLSPVLRRKGKVDGLEGLEDDMVLTVTEDFKGGQFYHDLETFQKAQLKHKVKFDC